MNDSGPVQNAGEVSTESGPVTIKADTCTPACSGHIITGTGTSNVNTITVTSGTHDITLQDVNIDVSSQPGIVAFSIEGSAKVNLTLAGENTLKSGSECAGLQVPGGAELVITKDSQGSLDATGGGNGTVVLCVLAAMLAAATYKRRRRVEAETETAE